jgi:hypothetical protein
MPDLADTIDKLLTGTTGALAARFFELGKDAAMDAAEWPWAQIIEHLDKRICDLCRAVNGKMLLKGSPEWARWHLPSHLNCRRITVDVHKDEKDNEGNSPRQDIKEPPDGMSQEAWDKVVKQHGHFLNDPKKYSALRIPARPTGRDFIYSRGAEGFPGKLTFARALPDALLKTTLQRITLPIVEAATNGEVLLPADAHVLTQCARQSANREWYDDLPADLARHQRDWEDVKVLSQSEYKQVAGEVLDADPAVAACNYQSAKYGEVPTVIFHADQVVIGKTKLEDASLLWDADRCTISNVGKLDLTELAKEPGFRKLIGAW